jgi:hypothetical protein
MTVLQEIEILINSICSSLIPETVFFGDSRSKYEKTALLSSEIPPFGGA